MAKKKKTLVIAICSLLVFVTAASAVETGSKTKTTIQGNFMESSTVYAKAEQTGKAPVYKLDVADKLIIKNSLASLYLNKKTGAVKVADQSNGYIWSSIPQNDNLDGLNHTWKGFARSIIAVDYINADGKDKRLCSGAADDIEYTDIPSGFRMTASFDEEGITVGADVSLNGSTLSIKIPKDIIKDNDAHQVSTVYVMPYFGAVREDRIPGYSFIPDRCGALIRFEKQKNYMSPYQADIYGIDQGATRPQDLSADAKRAAIPVFGMVHGSRQNAFLAVAKTGDEFGQVLSYPAGVITPFNWTCFAFYYRYPYYQKTDRDNGGYSTYSKKRNDFDICVDYSLLSGQNAGYAGMAVKYREMLIGEGKLQRNSPQNGNMPLRIEAVMAETAPSVIGTRVIGMTNTNDIAQWADQLSSVGIARLTVSLNGWEAGGVDGHKLGQNSPDGSGGSKADYDRLVKKIEGAGGSVYFVKNTIAGYEHQLDMNHNGIVNIDGTVTSQTDKNAAMFQTQYYNNIGTVNTLNKTVSDDSFLKDKLIAYDELPFRLYSDFKKSSPVARKDTLSGACKSLSCLPAQKQAVYNPSAYAFSYAKAVFDTPVSGSGYLYALEYVPFLEIVLSGSAELYSPYCNFIINSKEDILKMVDFDVYPSFILTRQPTYLFAKTNLNNIFSSQFDDWKKNITDVYKQMSPVLSKVVGKSIINRETPSEGLSVVTYEGNIKVFVNYNNKAIAYAGNKLSPLSATVIE